MIMEDEDYQIRKDEFFQALRKNWMVYGDMLEYLTIPIGDIPSKVSENAFRLVQFYEEVTELSGKMLQSFISLILLENGFITKM